MFNRFNGNVEPFASDATGTNRTIFGDTAQSDDIDDNLNPILHKQFLENYCGYKRIVYIIPFQLSLQGSEEDNNGCPYLLFKHRITNIRSSRAIATGCNNNGYRLHTDKFLPCMQEIQSFQVRLRIAAREEDMRRCLHQVTRDDHLGRNG